MDCNSLPGLKRTAFPGGMDTSAPVRGLRPMPVFRGRTLNTPKPRSSMRSPLASDRFMLSKTVSTASSALVLVIPVLFTTSLMMSSFITGGSQAEESLQSNQVLDAKEDKRDCQPPGFVRVNGLTSHRGSFRLWLGCVGPEMRSRCTSESLKLFAETRLPQSCRR